MNRNKTFLLRHKGTEIVVERRMTPCSFVDTNVLEECDAVLSSTVKYSSTLKMEAEFSFETLVCT
jgi:hypothetical protein